MQRQVLVPISVYMSQMEAQGKQPSDMKVLEVAGGTGRLMTFIRDNYPTMDSTLLELSPYYLEEARKNDAYWRKFVSADKSRSLDPEPLKLVQGLAEDMPFPTDNDEEKFDIITCVYLFHELPREIRRQVAASFFKNLKPGGLVAWNDSVQAIDRPELGEKLKLFPSRFHEPYYNDYVEDDIEQIFLDAGFVRGPVAPIISNRSKAMCWIKPTTTPKKKRGKKKKVTPAKAETAKVTGEEASAEVKAPVEVESPTAESDNLKVEVTDEGAESK